jgi:RimJ/RimL family protein N-acetyltransferase
MGVPASNIDPPIQLVVIRTSDQVLIGGVRLEGELLSFFFTPTIWRRGFASEVLQVACPMLLNRFGHRRLSLHICRENIASQKVAARLGCAFQGLISLPTARGTATFLQYSFEI